MIAKYKRSVSIHVTQKQWNALDALAEPHGHTRSSYIRACIFSSRPPFTSDEDRKLWESVRQDDGVYMSSSVIKITDEQKRVLNDMVKDAGFETSASYVRECIFDERPDVRDPSLDAARIHASRHEDTPLVAQELRQIGLALHGARSIDFNMHDRKVTFTFDDIEDVEYLFNKLY